MRNKTVRACGKDFDLLRKLDPNGSPLCIYACGGNGEIVYDLLRRNGKDIEYFVDLQADDGEFKVLGKRVISPDTFIKDHKNEKVIVTPDDHTAIVRWLVEQGIKQEDIIIPFKEVEKEICIYDDGYLPQSFKPSATILHAWKPDVSAFTILYNTPREMLCRAIESILNQSYTNLKYVIIDNGSTDDSAKIIGHYCAMDDRIVYVRLDKNVVWTDRILLHRLKESIDTDYVAMLDSDDYYERDFLQKAIRISREHQADMVQVNTLTYAHNGFKYSYFTHHYGRDICVEGEEKKDLYMQRIIFVPVWGKLFSGPIFREFIGRMLSVASDEERDRDFCLDVSWITDLVFACDRVAVCDEILHIRTWRPGSSENSDDHRSKWLSSIVWSFDHMRDVGISYEESKVFEEAQLNWLFHLKRSNGKLPAFRAEDLNNRGVKEFMNRPVCDRYRGQ